MLPLPRLRSFSCWQAVLTPLHLAYLHESSHLTELSVMLYTGYDFGHWPELRTLRIEFCDKADHSLQGPFRVPTYVNLTTLAVNDHVGSEWLDSHLRRVHFPRLRVLNLQAATSPPWLVYQFIHRHPTVLEVNLSFDSDYDHWFAFDRLLKLIEGTGTWGPMDAPGSTFDDPFFSFEGISDALNETYAVSTRFAFSRVSLYSEGTHWDQPEGSRLPRYTATALAMDIVDQVSWEDDGMSVLRLHQFLERMHRVFPEMVELRLVYGTPHFESSFERVMEACASSLRNWTSLRKLTFSWGTIQDDEFPIPDLFPWHLGADFNQFPPYDVLGEVHPPIHIERDWFDTADAGWLDPWPRTGQPYSARELQKVFCLDEVSVEIMREVIRAACDQEMDDDTLMDTPGLPLQAWITRHERFVMKLMRLLAVNCPTLETIAWYPVGETIWCAPVRWLWKVHREKESRAIRMLSNEFAYRGCPQGDPPPLWILVGQELVVAEEYPAMVNRKYWKDDERFNHSS
ncbi:hypothetical protein DAEQUDRAFT_720223 [Daedalea quercina L-15889]|uniref:Uncharacterized protein n=1 Tax=Daedalea quercina L-15889 TaxID=1314783 RepID=A0A165UJT0_9APHY|nr:hypothetical protein DAEQUDRAFT_720223 [Daedalea quercina L-15889]